MSGPHRGRWSEAVLRLVVHDAESVQGLLGDLHEERGRAGNNARGGRGYDRAVLRLAGGYLTSRFRPPTRRRPGSRRDDQGVWRSTAEDVRFAARRLRRRPGFSAAIVGTLGLGFGAAAAVLSVAYGVWLRPIPFASPEELIRIYEVKLGPADAGSVSGDGALQRAGVDNVVNRSRLSPPLLEDLRDREWVNLSAIASVSGINYDWDRESGKERVLAHTASRDVFAALGLEPLHGRAFASEPGTREVILAEGFWRREFGGDPAVIGRDSLLLDGDPYLIVGVVRDGLPYPQAAGDLWTPRDRDPSEMFEGMRGARYLDVVARLRPGSTADAAAAELDAFVRELGTTHPNHAGWGATAVPLREDLVRPFAGILRLLFVGAVLFLLIACANVSGLVAARRTRDAGERGLRLALGASRLRVVREAVFEMLLLSLAGAAAAAAFAAWTMAPLQRLAPRDIPRIADIRLDGAVVAAMVLGVLIAGVLVALVGNATSRGESRWSRFETRAATRNDVRGRALLIVAQVALTTILLVGGSGLAAHFLDLARIEPGFQPNDLLTTSIVLSENAYPDKPARLQFFEALVSGFEQRGHEAAFGLNPPVAGTTMRFGYRAAADEDQHWGQYHTVSANYFRLLGIPLVAGRTFDEDDRAESVPVVIVSEALAREQFDGDALGRELIVVGAAREIVGVVGSVHHFGPDQAPPTEMYVPLAQDTWLLGNLMVRPGEGYSPDSLREVVATIDPNVAVESLFPFEDFVRTWFAPLRFQLTIVVLLAMAGTVLALVGLYALVAYLVADRTREIGIRVALGETAASVFARVVRGGLGLAGGGLLLGMVLALSLRGLLRSFGPGVELDDPGVLVVVSLLVAVAATLASAWPARRAALLDPVKALRQE